MRRIECTFTLGLGRDESLVTGGIVEGGARGKVPGGPRRCGRADDERLLGNEVCDLDLALVLQLAVALRLRRFRRRRK